MKLQRVEVNGERGTDGYVMWVFWCPGCKATHRYTTDRAARPARPVWTFNGNQERPTFSPSLLMFTTRPVGGDANNPADERVTLCHLFVREGRIEYCGDCPHELAGKTVDMVEIPEEERW